jgi:hypothetical protein
VTRTRLVIQSVRGLEDLSLNAALLQERRKQKPGGACANNNNLVIVSLCVTLVGTEETCLHFSCSEYSAVSRNLVAEVTAVGNDLTEWREVGETREDEGAGAGLGRGKRARDQY